MRLISWNIRKSNAWELGGTPILGHPHTFGKVGESCSQDGPADLNTDCSGNTLTTDCVQKSSKKYWNHMKPSYFAANYHVQKQDMHQNRSIWVKQSSTTHLRMVDLPTIYGDLDNGLFLFYPQQKHETNGASLRFKNHWGIPRKPPRVTIPHALNFWSVSSTVALRKTIAIVHPHDGSSRMVDWC